MFEQFSLILALIKRFTEIVAPNIHEKQTIIFSRYSLKKHSGYSVKEILSFYQ